MCLHIRRKNLNVSLSGGQMIPLGWSVTTSNHQNCYSKINSVFLAHCMILVKTEDSSF